MGLLPVPSRYACWAELLLIQIVTPNASFVGHLAGILAGLLYTMGPLKWIVDIVSSVIEVGMNGGRRDEPRYADENTWGYGRPSAPPYYSGEGRTTGERYDRYTGGMTEEEQMRRAMEESLRQRNRPTNYGWNYHD